MCGIGFALILKVGDLFRMRRDCKLALIQICGVGAVFFTGCQNLKLGDGLETKVENEWRIASVGVAGGYGSGPRTFSRAKAGAGVLVRLYESQHIKGSFDGTSYHEIAIQLPAETHEGARYDLRAVPWPSSPSPGWEAEMKAGEIVGLQFGNPRWGVLGKEMDGQLTVVSIGERKVTVYLRLKAELEPIFSFDIDRSIELDVVR